MKQPNKNAELAFGGDAKNLESEIMLNAECYAKF